MNFRSDLRYRTRTCGGRKKTEINQIVGKHFVGTLTLCIVISFLTNSLFARIINQHDDIYIVFHRSHDKKLIRFTRIRESFHHSFKNSIMRAFRLSAAALCLSAAFLSFPSAYLCRACCPGSHFGFKQLSAKHSMGRRIRRCHRRLRLCRRRSRHCRRRCRRQRADG